ncbi:hypothetical protein D918_05857 [Trichuris suis]|nr:hypothetical protein D918_05857 [Trichuris suis]
MTSRILVSLYRLRFWVNFTCEVLAAKNSLALIKLRKRELIPRIDLEALKKKCDHPTDVLDIFSKAFPFGRLENESYQGFLHVTVNRSLVPINGKFLNQQQQYQQFLFVKSFCRRQEAFGLEPLVRLLSIDEILLVMFDHIQLKCGRVILPSQARMLTRPYRFWFIRFCTLDRKAI